MDKIQQEMANTDPDVAFRATAFHIHHTWAKTFQSRPELYLRPQSLEEVQKIVNLARRCKRRLVVVGCGHSPSDLTCSSSWMVNLDEYSRVLNVDKQRKTMNVEGGIRLRDLNAQANAQGLTMPNLGSIHDQSIVGAMATATHGSSMSHGLLSESVRSLRIVLSNGQAVRCSAERNQDLFRAALVSLGALGIITEIEFEMTDSCNIEWVQTLKPLSDILTRWDTDLWHEKEFTRVWWMPYMKRAIVWSAEKTEKPQRQPGESWYGGSVGYHTYHNLLWLSNYVPWILPAVEWFVFGMQYGFSTGQATTAVEELRTGLLMNCLYSQFVNEWALPLSKGPEAINRLSAWINGETGSGIPFSVKGLYVHCPIEVRVSDTTLTTSPRPFLDNTCAVEPTLYLNATLYRPYLQDPPCTARYYEAFEWLMRDMGGKPHWAKNWSYTSKEQIGEMYGENMTKWAQVRGEADPEGMFLGEWHKRSLPLPSAHYPLMEREVMRRKAANGGQFWVGRLEGTVSGEDAKEAFGEAYPSEPSAGGEKSYSPSASSSGESFDLMHAGEVESSMLFNGADEGSDTDRDVRRTHGHPKEGVTGIKVFDKM
ncbi:hypothetical protein MBLNU230_g7446t1 [Neophaeotheca triangularis]